MSEWISVKDRLPESYDDVLVVYGNGNIGIDWRTAWPDFCYGDHYGGVTHWMPLPEPPEELEKGTIKREGTTD